MSDIRQAAEEQLTKLGLIKRKASMKCYRCGIEDKDLYGHELPHKFICANCYFKEYEGKIETLQMELANIKQQLPANLQYSKILFKSCEYGHSWLVADSWINVDECPYCKSQDLEKKLEAQNIWANGAYKDATDKLENLGKFEEAVEIARRNLRRIKAFYDARDMALVAAEALGEIGVKVGDE